MVAIALSWIAVSCAGTNFFKIPVPGGTPVVAAAAAPAPLGVAASGWSGAGIFLLFALALAITIAAANFIASSSYKTT